jgi:EF hand
MKKPLMTVVFLGALSGLARAEETGAIPFYMLDVDGDNVLSMTEAGALPDITAQWRTLDKDGDGKLDRGEYTGYVMPASTAGRQD